MGEPQIVVGVAVIRAGRVLAALRPGPDGGWEFPGGKVEPGETDQQAAVRELREELALEIAPGASLGPAQPIGDRYLLRVYAAALVRGEPVLHEHSAIRWVDASELAELDWLPADRPFLIALRVLLGTLC
ncbi:(deoxy)nucleoside triphosphate pyrophosphohydrolase [Streptomyces sp. SID13031]|uniref:(deoxy)nucleoside triphosphate pyrophosphohydrolase n=1 Tax=Streptomyces sp. SID13031 TaxID=2706046 RepID=UPI0013C86132|nr:(deoxy)nucleoside triphosphate pyrophosphohydrolase [Streptomyces sp. SID13031]NEA32174.1 (deoxy)nucleoside triphosphate pyrophosphohydrolase [Streptomyces sp. SID13031]